jgi:nucleoside-diphosphate-sugar epimerase
VKGLFALKVFMIGGTGLLGSAAARELIARGHEVCSMALPPLPEGADLPPEMKIELGNAAELSDSELRKRFTGCEGFVFAAGVDERVEGPPPIYDFFKKHNIDALERLLRIAKESGVKKTAICGSYFSYFSKENPELELTKWHPYIRSRIDQEDMALKFADENFSVGILQLPYIFGTQPGRKPVWVFLVEMIQGMKGVTMYPGGGTTMITVRQAGQAIAGALEKTQGGKRWPIGYYNMPWQEFLKIVHKHMGMPNRKVLTIPKWVLNLGSKQMAKERKAKGIEGGLDMIKFSDIQCSCTFIDKELGCLPLGVAPDDIERAIGESVKLSLDILRGKTEAIGMKGE